jgi:SagB-type dehydrogenase family enzyme
VKTLALSFPDLPIQLIRAIITNLFSANFILRSSPSCETLEETPPLCLWEFHDLLFHARSRLGRHSNPYGGTYRFRNKIEPLPAAKPQLGLPTILFDKIDRSQIDSQNIPFIRVLDNRKSIRNHGDEVLSKEELGMFLFLTARTKEIFDTPYGQLSRRPYPSGGASYELEIYVLVNRCTSIPKALYHYCPLKHALFRVADQNEYTHALLESAWHTVQRESRPHVLLIITSRIGRVSWKYQSIAYSLILKHVGVLVQTMYLVATQLGLAPCALGGGDSDLFSLASGINYYEETSVCEFILGKPTPSIDS